ncbi:MAG: phosphoserine phosphatase SerB [Myxococcales bacterium]|nr:phosphoserine phosphatase SerB [Myxococcales bacterium]
MTHFVVTALDASRSLPLHALGELIEHSAHRLHAQVAERAEHGTGVRAVLESGSTEPARAHAVNLRRSLAQDAAAAGVRLDLAVQPSDLRRPPRLLVMDMDSTLITIEVIDELARRHGVGAEVAAITERAMRGELDFEASLRARVHKLAGLPASALDAVAASLELSPGAAELIAAMQARGVAVAIASGGFSFAADLLRQRLGLTAAFSNQLELSAGALTGRVLGNVVTAERKAEVVHELAAAAGVTPQEAVAIGDGANDRLMLAAAGFGVAFRAKPALAAVADATIDHGGLERVLEMLD